MRHVRPVLFLSNAAHKRLLPERLGDTRHDDDAQSDLDATLAQGVANGVIARREPERALDGAGGGWRGGADTAVAPVR